MVEMCGEIVGAIIVLLLLSLLFRMILLKVTKLQRRLATTIACVCAIFFCTFGAMQTMGQSALVLYPAGGVIVWIWLFFNLSIYKKKKTVSSNSSST